MDEIYTAVFDKILQACKGGGYAIIDSDEFFDALPDGERKNTEEIESALKYLQKNGYIDLKYAKGNLYCVTALKNCLPVEEKTDAPSATTVVEVKQKINRKCVAFYSLASFLGGAAGSLIVCLAVL